MRNLVLVPSLLELKQLVGEVPLQGEQVPFYQRGLTTWALAGIGPAAAAFSAGLAIQAHQPDRLILLGIAGAFPGSGFRVNQVVQAHGDVLVDLGHRDTRGFHLLDEIPLPVLRYAGQTHGCAYDLPLLDGSAPSAAFVTRSSVTTDLETARQLEAQFGAGVESMEGAAVAMAASAMKVPCYQVRAISNMVGPRDPASWSITPALANLRAWLERYEL